MVEIPWEMGMKYGDDLVNDVFFFLMGDHIGFPVPRHLILISNSWMVYFMDFLHLRMDDDWGFRG